MGSPIYSRKYFRKKTSNHKQYRKFTKNSKRSLNIKLSKVLQYTTVLILMLGFIRTITKILIADYFFREDNNVL